MNDTTRTETSELPATPLVGMVASAGGLTAFKDFFRAMPADSGIAFVLVPHLDPDHESLMVTLLAKQTDMPVVEALDGQKVEPDHIYIIPPGCELTLHAGVIQLAELASRAAGGTPIDPFLRSLAEDQQENAICIILSGTGSHGTLGLKAIKAGGGMAMVQDPASAEYDRMPRSAIDTGLADYILPPGHMPEALLGYVQHFTAGKKSVPEPALAQDDLTRVLALLNARTRFDFRVYRKGMLLRRIQRRMGLNHLDQLADYLDLLREQPEELGRLGSDLLISVTAFFRDPEMYEFLEARVLPELLKDRDSDSPVRVWVPGCATGEEAYSIAMVLIEHIEAMGKDCPIHVFATDINEHSLEIARHGSYPQSTLADMGRRRRERFFSKTGTDDLWQVNKQLRETVLFATQNLLSDACFSKLDLVSCRNLLIYLEPAAQQQLLQLFHFALNENGYLILGTSESIGRHVELYRPVSRKWRIYRRVGGARPGRAGFPVQTGSYRHQPYRAYPQHGLDNLTELTRNILLQDYAPAAVVIDLHYEVLHYSGNTRLYLQQPGGSPSNDLLTLVPTSLRPRIRAAVHQAMQASRRVDIGAIPLQRDDRDALVSIGVQPLPDPQRQEPLFLVTFRDEPETPPHGAAGDRTTGAGPDDSLVQQLEYELKTSREELHSTIEELESSNEELNASNEEVMSMNEELQSTNEELESSKEELQSVNEELITVNTQLRDKIAELEETNNDLTNLMTSVDTAILFIGVDGVIRRFTPRVTSLFNVIDSDLGRPLGDINRRFEDPQLQQDIDRVMQDLAPHLREVQSDSGQWFQRAITPYRTASNQIEGVVLSFTDITRIKHAELELQRLAETLEQRVAERTSELENEVGMRAAAQAALQESEQRFRAVFNDAPVGMCQADPGDGQLLLVNPEVCAMTGYSEAELLQRALPEILHPQDREAGRELLARLMRGELPLYQAQQRFIRRDGTVLWGDLRVMLVRDHQGQPLHSVAVIADITERKQLAAQLLQERNFGNTVLDTVASLILVIDADGKLVRFNRACEVLTGYDFDEFVGSADWWTLVPAEEHDALQRIMQRLLSGEELLARESRWLTRDGAVKLLSWRYTVIRDPAGQAQYIIGSGIDITDQREAEDEARQHLEEASRLQRLQTAGELATMLAHELNQPLGAIAMYAETGEHLLASETLDQDRLTDILAQISQQSLRAAEIIRRLRAFVSQGRIDSRPLDLGMVVRNACELMAPEARKFGIGLHSEQDDGLGQVMGVEVHIEQVLLNLIRNAIQAIHDSGTRDGSITISIRRVADVARVSVLDNGPGIDPAAAEDLFALLASHKKAGLGVGLRISRSLIEAQGGRLWAEAHKPGGIFHFELPLSA